MNDLALGVPVLVLVPAVVEVAKRAGLPTRYAGLAAIAAATALVALADLASGGSAAGTAARWLLAGVIDGLAGVGLYSQVRRLPGVVAAPDEGSGGGGGNGAG